MGGGFTEPVNTTGQYTNVGWNVGGGLGFNFDPYVGALVDLNYDRLAFNSTTLGNVGGSGGGLHVFSATLDPIVHVTPKSHVDVYVTGGFGIYHLMQDFTQPAGPSATGYYPYLGYYNGAVSSYGTNHLGFDGGMGVAFGSRWHGKFFAEARFNRTLGYYHTDYVPVTFGFRW
ncbi:MAG: hypothetical protein ACLP59_35130 [Bryobacteraceae bacterium]